MNKFLMITLVITTSFLFGCQSAPPKPPEPIGEKSSVNPSTVYLIDLYKKEVNNVKH